jgi:AraC family transcriptional regulator of adaptative response/methylated-DNA-[protein]-cysteine methyltransferase
MPNVKDRRGATAGRRIRYVISKSSLGWVLVAATERGISAIELGESRRRLRADFARRCPTAELTADDSSLTGWAHDIAAHIDTGRDLKLPLDIQGTAFERRVWRAMQKTPAGSTTTYSGIARQIGNPQAARAVGRACAANRLAVVIPCHRVVRSDGQLGGYRWGVRWKKSLLERERGGRN